LSSARRARTAERRLSRHLAGRDRRIRALGLQRQEKIARAQQIAGLLD